jgi:hypothetical protein
MALFDKTIPLLRLALRIVWSERGRNIAVATVAEAFGVTNSAVYNTLCPDFERGAGPAEEGQLRAAYAKDVRRPVGDTEWGQMIFAGREAAHHLAAHLEALDAQRRERRRAHLAAAGRWSRNLPVCEGDTHA